MQHNFEQQQYPPWQAAAGRTQRSQLLVPGAELCLLVTRPGQYSAPRWSLSSGLPSQLWESLITITGGVQCEPHC